MVQSQPGHVVCETLSRKTLHKNRAGRVAQGEGPEFKPPVLPKKKSFIIVTQIIKNIHLAYFS
jgi:hypothetical protein